MSIQVKGGVSGTLADVKNASTAAVATDPTLVVGLNPLSNKVATADYTTGREKGTLPSATFGKYVANIGQVTVTAGADTAPAGKAYFWNPVGGTKIVRLRKIMFQQVGTASLATPTTPRIGLTRITLTGTGTGAQIPIMKLDSTCTAASAYLSLASTSATLANVALGPCFRVNPQFPSVTTYGGGSYSPSNLEWMPEEDEAIVLRAGEGVTIFQADAGTTSDSRTWDMTICWDESAT